MVNNDEKTKVLNDNEEFENDDWSLLGTRQKKNCGEVPKVEGDVDKPDILEQKEP